MFKQLLSLVIFILFCKNLVFAQSIVNSSARQKFIDSLSAILPQTQGKTRVNLLLKLANENRTKDHMQAIKQAREAVRLADESDKQSLPKLYALLGLIYHNQVNNFDSAHFFYDKAKNTATELGIKKDLVGALNDEGILFEDQNNYKDALANYLKALEISRGEKDTIGWMAALMNVGFVYKAQKDYDKAIDYFQESLSMSLMAHSTKREAENYYNLGMVYIDLKQYEKARTFLFKVTEFLDEKKNAIELGRLFHTIAVSYQHENNTVKSIEYLKKAIGLAEKSGNNKDLASAYIDLGIYYQQTGNFNLALINAQTGYDFAIKAGLRNKQEKALALLAELYAASGNFQQAFQYQTKRTVLKDSIYNETESRQRLEMLEKFETDKKQHENEILKAKTLIQETELHNRNITISFAILGLIVVVGLSLYLVFENHKKTILTNTLASQKQEIETQNTYLQELLSDKNNLLNVVAHDLRAPFNKISGLTELVRLEEGLNDAQEQYLGLIKSVIKQGSRLIDDLLIVEKPEEKSEVDSDDLSVNTFVNELLKEFSTQAGLKNIHLKQYLPEGNLVIQSNKDHLQRILDNLLSNAIKFSPKDKNIYLEVYPASGFINFVVRDEGPGFKEEDKAKLFNKFQRLSARPTGGEVSTGLGLAIVKKLTNQLNGTVLLKSEPGKGAEFIISIPNHIKETASLVIT